MKLRLRQPNPPPCNSFHDGREPCVPVRIGREDRNEGRSRMSRFGSGVFRIPLINNHLDCHKASPHAVGALVLVGLCLCFAIYEELPRVKKLLGFSSSKELFSVLCLLRSVIYRRPYAKRKNQLSDPRAAIKTRPL